MIYKKLDKDMAIVVLEAEVNKQKEIIEDLIKALTPFIDSCYKGCSKNELNGFRINAEKVIKSL